MRLVAPLLLSAFAAVAGQTVNPNPMDSIRRLPGYRPTHDTMQLLTASRIAKYAPKLQHEWTAYRGNMSLGSVKMFADHHWCAAAAMPTIRTATHRFVADGANMVGTMMSAATSIAVFRPAFADQPRFMNAPDNQPPNTDPTSASK